MEQAEPKVEVRELGGPAPVPAERPQEVDVWWGSWSGRTMLPSVLVCVVLTGAVVWWAWSVVDRRFVQLTFWGLAGAIWLVQMLRWSWRVFGYNYRLTSRRLIVSHGHWPPRFALIELANIEHIRVEPYTHSRWTGVGKLVVTLRAGKGEAVLEGVRRPQEIAELIGATMRQAQAA
jgi:hypothetical protein